TEARKA
ncbi:hypothetical protein D049_2317B, partial [Vibrio parahaemolyticus VPTS-2010]